MNEFYNSVFLRENEKYKDTPITVRFYNADNTVMYTLLNEAENQKQVLEAKFSLQNNAFSVDSVTYHEGVFNSGTHGGGTEVDYDSLPDIFKTVYDNLKRDYSEKEIFEENEEEQELA